MVETHKAEEYLETGETQRETVYHAYVETQTGQMYHMVFSNPKPRSVSLH